MNFVKGRAYYIKFLDHCLSAEHTLMESEILGWVVSQDENRVTLTYWNVTRKDWKKDSEEPINIIKSTILKKKVLTI